MNFQPPSRSLTTRDYLFIAVVSIFIIAVSAGLVYANLSLPKGGGDFLRHWAGARAFLFERIDPYTLYVPNIVQGLVYGDSAGAGDEPFILDTPFHLLLLYFPFSLLSDPMTARAIYALILEWALLALAILSLRLADWEAPRWFSVLFILFCFINYFAFQAILEASPVILLALIYAGIILAMRNEQDELAGALIALSVYYWEAGLPFLLLISWRSYKEGRARVLAGFGMISAVLLAISLLLYPGWILPALRAGMNNFRADYGFSIFTVLRHLLPGYGNLPAWVFVVLLFVLLGYEWNKTLNGDSRRLYWVTCLTLAATPLLGFRTGMDNLAVLVVPLALVFAVIHDRWKGVGSFLNFLFIVLIFTAPWALYLFALPRYGVQAHQLLFLFLPVFTVLGLYWIRWWAIRPPRVWADAVNRKT
ncbi:MAG: hypothetical protein L6Q49_02920 [Anaerolineales bacterium]|nr:hypothetical protein [Anaerolineales bacterium]